MGRPPYQQAKYHKSTTMTVSTGYAIHKHHEIAHSLAVIYYTNGGRVTGPD